MHIFEILNPATVAVGLTGTDKHAVIDATIDLVAARPEVTDPSAVRNAVHARENRLSTGVGKGLAIPHAKSSAVSGTIAALATTAEPVEFESIDHLPVQILFLLIGSPSTTSDHVRILSRVSRLMNRDEARSAILAAASPEELLESVRELELMLEASAPQ